ncbi:MAG: multicopper oxidase family protein [Desulfobacterales bacterium]|nr:MAG: multicopper oxidase family protein [Desulfobacterales bacterium]
MKISRRAFLKTSVGAALAAGLPSFWTASAAAQSRHAVREFHFSASPARINLGTGPDFVAWTYNGQVPGPEIRVREGETIRVILKNYLPEATTIHWHGVPVPNAMDGVPGVTQPAVRPGGTFVYEFEARPAGTYIYHSHAKYQLDQGLYGPLVIEASPPRESYDREYSLMLEDWVMQDGGGISRTQRRPPMGMMGGMRHGRMRSPSPGGPLQEPFYDGYAVNGRVYPAISPLEVRPGERVKIRLMNASSATIYYLRLAGHPLTITHLDGQPVRPVETDVLRIGMGERYDVMLTADNPGSWLLAASEEGFGEGRLRVPLRYRGVRPQEPVPPTFRPGLRMATYQDFSAAGPPEGPADAAGRFYGQTLSGGMHSPFWSINGRLYPDAEWLTVRNGERVRLSYGNDSMMPHPMHLHGHFFQVVNPALPPNLWVTKDTVIVDPMQRLDIEFRADNPGHWFHHCHNLYHMEAGMANVVVYEGWG